jgi:hypothetical protein
MGMFDYFEVDIDILPVDESTKEKMKVQGNFQTKDFDCTMNRIYVTEEGELTRYVYTNDYLEYLNSKGEWFPNVGEPNPENGVLEKIPFHGLVEFYDIIDGEWFEFLAKFSDNKLVEITLNRQYVLNNIKEI